MILSLAILALFLLYTILILYYLGGWEKLRPYVPQLSSDESPRNISDESPRNISGEGPMSISDERPVHFSVVVPARNEEALIGTCIRSILAQGYPAEAFEIIVVDDFSDDATASIVAGFQHPNVRLLRMSEHISGEEKLKAHKKKGIETAIMHAKGEWIVTTDADCAVSPRWLTTLNGFIREKNPDFVAAPVDYAGPFNSFLSVFQSLDFLSLQGITGAAAARKLHVLCNGANIAYNRELFLRMGGFTGIDHIASGDDMLLMQKFYRHRREGVAYLFSKDAIVRTAPMPTWKTFFHQRIRWASKADQYRDGKIFAVLLLVYLLNLSFPVLAIWALFQPGYGWFLLTLLLSKTLLELYFLWPVARFFGKTKQLIWFLPAQPFHILYTVAAGWMGKFGSYEWKGRSNRATG